MNDPFEALLEPIVPVAPDPIFAARLRERVRHALLRTLGDPMTTSSPLEARLRSLTPYICVDDGRRALDWYVQAFDAVWRDDPVVMDDGRIGHAELAIGDSVLMLADEWPELGLLGPKARGGPSQSIYLTVPDADLVVDRAVELGAELTRPVQDYPHGRNGVINDPFGHRWMITSPAPGTPAEEHTGPRHGDVGYVSLWLPDVERAVGFYGGVLTWQFTPGSSPEGRQVTGLPAQRIGLWGGQEHRTLFVCFTVDDVGEAVQRVRAAGGEAAEPTEEPYGLISLCTDDQGLTFAVYQPSDDPGLPETGEPTPIASLPPNEPPAADAPPSGSPADGEVAYLTFEVPDSERARAFYGAVLGWEFTPGRVTDGWLITNRGREVSPPAGLHGGHDQPTVVPMYAVRDITTAVNRVRKSGGTATDPETQPYGISSECTDDQGTHFYLGQF
ncbi:VOC family protein [Spirillospora sp. NPDC047279]|uniref:VOC family protein n=1 Tax=Spirillospora sp. NPDC047279 TaxID=3155478 RepID=UPI0033D05D0A